MSDYRRRTHTLLPLDSDALRPPKVSEKTWSKKRLAEGPCPGLINPTVLYPLSMHFVQGVLKTRNDANYGIKSPVLPSFCGRTPQGDFQKNVLVPRFFLLFSLLDVP